MADIKPNVHVDYTDHATVVTFIDRKILEEQDIRGLQESLNSVLDQMDDIRLVLDFCNVEFLSSAVLGLLIRLSKRIQERNGKLTLCSISPKIYEVFKITQLNKVFEISDDVENALADLA